MHTTPPTTTYLTGITTLEQIVSVAVEAIQTTPYCHSCDCDVHFAKWLFFMVGATRFELATTRPPVLSAISFARGKYLFSRIKICE